jgi:hypothetical protein
MPSAINVAHAITPTTQEPANGKLSLVSGGIWLSLPESNPDYACNGKKIQGHAGALPI